MKIQMIDAHQLAMVLAMEQIAQMKDVPVDILRAYVTRRLDEITEEKEFRALSAWDEVLQATERYLETINDIAERYVEVFGGDFN